MQNEVKKKPRFNPHLRFILLFPLVIFYYEIVFRYSTVKGAFSINILFLLLFSLAYGAILYIPASIFKKRNINFIITSVLLGVSALIYIIQYFIYRFFKIFYDISTVFGGAGDAITDYFEITVKTVFTFKGLFTIFLFFLPLFLYLIFGRRFFPAVKSDFIKRFMLLSSAAIILGVTVLLVNAFPTYKTIYSTEYNYHSAVSNFGLITGLKLDIKSLLSNDYNLEGVDKDAMAEIMEMEKEANKNDTDENIEYGKNELDIDFNELASASSGTYKVLDEYVATLTPSSKNKYTGLFKDKNLIMITAEAFSAQLIDPELTPTLYRLATKGINFTDYYQPASAGTTGGEYQNIFGMLPTDGGKSVKNASDNLNYYTMGSFLDREGYYGKAYHNNSYTYYDRNITHFSLGYSDGFMGIGNGMEEYVSEAWPQSDLEMFQGTVPTYINKDKFNIYYMTVSGHSAYTLSGNSMTYKNWERVQHLEYSDRVKGYFAANLELEDAMAYLVKALEDAGIADDTVICISTDHFPYGLDDDAALGNMPYLSELYGYNVTNYMERDKNRLIIWSGCLEDEEPIIVDTPTTSLDIIPTLANLFGLEFDSRLLPGRDVFSDAIAIAFNSYYDWKTSYGTYIASSGTFIPADPSVQLPDGYVEMIRSIVRGKISYCEGVLDSDYFRHVFG